MLLALNCLQQTNILVCSLFKLVSSSLIQRESKRCRPLRCLKWHELSVPATNVTFLRPPGCATYSREWQEGQRGFGAWDAQLAGSPRRMTEVQRGAISSIQPFMWLSGINNSQCWTWAETWKALFRVAQNTTRGKWTTKECGAPCSPFSSPIFECRHLWRLLVMPLVRNQSWRWHRLPCDIFCTFYIFGEMRISILLRKLCRMYCFISSNRMVF